MTEECIKMTEAEIETLKRMDVVGKFVESIKDKATGVILVGSLAYAPNVNVTKKSDIDLIVIYDDIKDCADDYFKESPYLKKEFYDGYLVKRHKNVGHPLDIKSRNKYDLNISIHNLSLNSLQKISYGAYETVAYYRQYPKKGKYSSKDFNGNVHEFMPDCVRIQGQEGERRIDKIAFPAPDGSYVIGNDIDKILSGAVVLHDPSGEINKFIDKTWENVTSRLLEHRKIHGQSTDTEDQDIGPYLFRYDRFSEETKQEIKHRTQKGISQAKSYRIKQNREDTLKNISQPKSADIIKLYHDAANDGK